MMNKIHRGLKKTVTAAVECAGVVFCVVERAINTRRLLYGTRSSFQGTV